MCHCQHITLAVSLHGSAHHSVLPSHLCGQLSWSATWQQLAGNSSPSSQSDEKKNLQIFIYSICTALMNRDQIPLSAFVPVVLFDTSPPNGFFATNNAPKPNIHVSHDTAIAKDAPEAWLTEEKGVEPAGCGTSDSFTCLLLLLHGVCFVRLGSFRGAFVMWCGAFENRFCAWSRFTWRFDRKWSSLHFNFFAQAQFILHHVAEDRLPGTAKGQNWKDGTKHHATFYSKKRLIYTYSSLAFERTPSY